MSENLPPDLQAALDEAGAQADAAEQVHAGGTLAPAKNALVQLVQRATAPQRSFNRALLRALREVAQRAYASDQDAMGRRMGGIEGGLDRLDARLSNIEKRTARTEALLAGISVDLGELREQLGARPENGAARRDG